MTTRDDMDRDEKLDRLKAILDAHGGDRDRWPAADRLELSRLIACDPLAARLVREAQALDQLIDKAPLLPDQRFAVLSQRIVAAAKAEGRWQGEGAIADGADIGGTAVRSGAAGGSAGQSTLPVGNAARVRAAALRPARGVLQSAALMALSLFMGIVAGATVLSGDTSTGGASFAEAGEETVLSQFVTSDGLDAIEEDLL